MTDLRINGLQEVKAYFIKMDGTHELNFPDTVTLTVQCGGKDYTFRSPALTTATAGEMQICIATFSDLGWMDDVTALKIVAKVENPAINGMWMALFDGDGATNACSITADSNAAGWLDIELKDAHVITEVNVYLIGTEPDAKTVELRDAFHGETAQHYRYPNQITAITSGAQTIWRATLRWYNRTTLLECFTAQRFGLRFTGDVQIAEIEIVTRDARFSTRENQWPGEVPGVSGSTAAQGLANQSLTNGEISFTVPEAGLFTQDEGNKEVYHNIQVPYVYDASTGYYTFNTGITRYDGSADFPEKDGHDVHFADTNGNGKIDKDECYDGAVLVMDETRYYPVEGQENKPGFFPFNVGSDRFTPDPPNANGIPHYPFYTETDITEKLMTCICA